MNLQARYTVGRKIADGGTAEIFLATQHGIQGFEKTVALKRIFAAFYADPQFRNMLFDEARIAMSLNHSNIVQVLDLGESEGQYVMALELVDGWSLDAILRRTRALGTELPPELALYLTAEVCRALAYAHAKTGPSGEPLGIVHRDISPHNVLVSEQGEVKLTDFGIAKAHNRREQSVGNLIKGKIAFMSPEQASGKQLDARSDLFSLGTMLYVMLCRRYPFDAATDLEVLLLVKQGACVPPETARPGLHPEVYRVLERAMAPDPATRFQRAEDMLLDVEHVMRLAFRAVGQTELKRWLSELTERDGVLPLTRAALPSMATGPSGSSRGGPTPVAANDHRGSPDRGSPSLGDRVEGSAAERAETIAAPVPVEVPAGASGKTAGARERTDRTATGIPTPTRAARQDKTPAAPPSPLAVALTTGARRAPSSPASSTPTRSPTRTPPPGSVPVVGPPPPPAAALSTGRHLGRSTGQDTNRDAARDTAGGDGGPGRPPAAGPALPPPQAPALPPPPGRAPGGGRSAENGASAAGPPPPPPGVPGRSRGTFPSASGPPGRPPNGAGGDGPGQDAGVRPGSARLGQAGGRPDAGNPAPDPAGSAAGAGTLAPTGTPRASRSIAVPISTEANPAAEITAKVTEGPGRTGGRRPVTFGLLALGAAALVALVVLAVSSGLGGRREAARPQQAGREAAATPGAGAGVTPAHVPVVAVLPAASSSDHSGSPGTASGPVARPAAAPPIVAPSSATATAAAGAASAHPSTGDVGPAPARSPLASAPGATPAPGVGGMDARPAQPDSGAATGNGERAATTPRSTTSTTTSDSTPPPIAVPPSAPPSVAPVRAPAGEPGEPHPVAATGSVTPPATAAPGTSAPPQTGSAPPAPAAASAPSAAAGDGEPEGEAPPTGVAETQPRVAILFKSSPPGAEVTSPRHSFGPTPVSIRLRIGARYALTFSHDGFRPVTKRIVVGPASEPEVTVTLKRLQPASTKPATATPAGQTPASPGKPASRTWWQRMFGR